MWQTDSVTFQTKSEVNTYGSITQTWTDTATVVKCDVQDINQDIAHKQYGLSPDTNHKQVFDHTNAAWVLGSQVKYGGLQWWVVHIDAKMDKMGLSNHTYVILEKVI